MGARVSFGIPTMFIKGLGSFSGKNLKTVWTWLKHCRLNLPGL